MEPILAGLLEEEAKRQHDQLCMIPSENYSSTAVRNAVGSVAMHKYSEGYPGARYYEGNEYVDQIEVLAIERARELFKLPPDWGVNVQPLAGANANLAVYNALLQPGDKILSMYLPDGGHLSHGWSYEQGSNSKDMAYYGGNTKVSIVSKIFNIVQYKTNPDTFLFDYDFIEKLAIKEQPKLIITGGTAYPRDIDYRRMRAIADKVGAYYLADIAHEAGLIAAGVLPSPVGIADVVTFTTHKTMRGPKGAVILASGQFIDAINRSIFPGLQGGPHNGTIAGLAQAFYEASQPEFKDYAKQIIANAQKLAQLFTDNGFKVISGGTDKHLVLVDMSHSGIDGRKFSRALSYAGIIINKNTIPWETKTPVSPSGIRLGTPFITTRGMKETEMEQIMKWIVQVYGIVKADAEMKFVDFDAKYAANDELRKIAKEVKKMCDRFPLP